VKVLFQSHPHLGPAIGGGPTVIHSLAKALHALGVDITFHNYWEHDIRTFDLVHYFSWFGAESWLNHLESYPRLVVTPISWFGESKMATVRDRSKWALRALVHRSISRKRLGFPFEVPVHFFPNSEGEAAGLGSAHRIPRSRMTIVPHGVASRFDTGDASLFESTHGRRDFVLCVGRFEHPRKNQLNLIRALNSTQMPLVFIGGPEPGHEDYYNQCRREANDNMLFLPPVKRDDPMLVSAYHACKVVVMPALLESPGLTGLEGALAGANVAATQFGSTQEYFGSHITYFDPRSPDSIREAVASALQAPQNTALRDMVRERYTWDRIAVQQKAAYEALLSGSRR
jgi:glycosyltransferase involved in cell wall biosynthesis